MQSVETNRRIVTALLAVTFLACASSGAMQAYLSLFLLEAEWSFDLIGLAGALFAGGILVGAALVGALVRPQHADRLLIFSCVTMSLSAVGYAVVDGVAWIHATRLLEGVSVGLFLVASESMLLDRAGEVPGAPVAARYTMANAAGHILGPALAGAAVWLFSPQHPFYLALLLALMATFVVIQIAFRYGSAAVTAVKPDVELTAVDLAASAPPSRAEQDEQERQQRGLGFLSLADASLCTFAFGSMQSALLVVLPPLLESERAWSTAQATGALALFALGATVMAVPSVRIATRIQHGVLLPMQTGVGAAMLFVLLALPPWGLVDTLLVLLFGMAVGSMSPVCLDALRLRFAGRTLLRATAVYNGFYAGGLLLGAPVAGLLAGEWGERGAVYTTGFGLAVAAATLVVLHLLRRRAGLTRAHAS